MNTDVFKAVAVMSQRYPHKVTKLAIRRRGNKHYLYAYTGPVNRVVIGSFSTFDEALTALNNVKKLLKEE
ncbi:MAG: hypothetical protein IJG64_00250 [Oscillospiraceae bacterium]|nr:hypothetical protein [Oscillospiraceae bacterium]